MSRLKVSQNVIEVLGSYPPKLKVSAHVVEVLTSMPGTFPANASRTAVPLIFPGYDFVFANGQHGNVLGTFQVATGQPNQTVTIHVTTQLSASHNLSIIDGINTYSVSTAALVTVGDKTYANVVGGRTYYITSFNAGTYNASLAGAGNYDYVGLPQPVGVAVSQDVVEVLMGDTGNPLKVSQDVVEVLVADTAAVAAAGGATAHVSIT